ncbi:MAG TPA: hypothetical protein VIM36_01685 [Gemmatimonadaceae bacterium]|jgi:hypothetical protein
MRSPAAAIAWEFRQRHRWGLVALIVYLLVLATIKLVVLARAVSIHLDSPESFAFVVVVPLTATFTYFLAVFTYGLDGDIAARQSMYPARMFTQPVTTATLAGLPMLYGAAAMMILWLATRLFALWPSEIEVPIVWPALLAASLLGWTQALTWMPYPLPGLRIIVTVLWLGTIDAVALVALHFQLHESVMVWIVAPQVPLAYLAARFAVARARRGDIPDWRGAFTWLTQIARTQSRQRGHFRSPASAQAWFEWRRNGRSLPAWVAILLPFELALLWASVDASALVFEVLLIVLLTPPFMATFAAATVGKSSPDASASYGVTPFIATRPLTNGDLIVAKLKMTIWSTVATWLLVLVALAVALELSGASAVMLERWRRLIEVVGTPRAVVALVLILSGCIASTWKQLVQSLYIGLTGRESLIKGIVFLTLVLLFLVGPFAEWVVESGHLGELWSALPMIFAALVGFKIIAATWIAFRLYRGRLLSDRAFVTVAAFWCVAVFALYGVLVWLLDAPHFPHYLLMLVAILAIPLARLSAAPLALAWNRHR